MREGSLPESQGERSLDFGLLASATAREALRCCGDSFQPPEEATVGAVELRGPGVGKLGLSAVSQGVGVGMGKGELKSAVPGALSEASLPGVTTAPTGRHLRGQDEAQELRGLPGHCSTYWLHQDSF